MKYQAPYGSSDPNASYVNGDPSTGTPGSIPPAAAFEQPQREIANAITKSGRTPDNANLLQLTEILRAQSLNYIATVGGTANALTATLDPVIASYAELTGTPLRLKIALSNTGPATLALNGLVAQPILTPLSNPIARGDLVPNAIVTVIPTGTSFLLSGMAYSEVYRPVFGTITVYVRTDGDDANDGSANTAAKAKKTIKAAINDTLRNVILNGQKLIVQLGIPGTYAGAPVSGSGVNVTVVGNTAAVSSYVITEATGTQYCVLGSENGSVVYQGVCLSSTYAGAALPVWAQRGGRVRLETCRIDRLISNAGTNLFYAASGGSISIGGTLDLVGAEGGGSTMEACVKTELGGIFEGSSFEVPSTWRPYNLNCSAGFALAGISSSQNWLATTMSPVGSGNFGKRYAAVGCGVINTAGAGVNFFPGATAGTTASGGQYV